METETHPPLDGKAIAEHIFANRNNPEALSFWAGMAAARLQQYQRSLEALGIPLPERG